MSITEIKAPAPTLPAGRTPNEMISGTATAADIWLASRRDNRALSARAESDARAYERVIAQDRSHVRHLFAAHVAELERTSMEASTIGAGVLGVAGGLWNAANASKASAIASKVNAANAPVVAAPWPGARSAANVAAPTAANVAARYAVNAANTNTNTGLADVLGAALVGGALGAFGGFALGAIYENVYGPVRPRVSAQLPADIEAHLCETMVAAIDDKPIEEVPPWRIEGWRQTWAQLAAEYTGAGPALVLPTGAPSPRELLGAIPSRWLPR
jgi:hypothetical protein